jgi:putative addiction module component (TIGR02574 family)
MISREAVTDAALALSDNDRAAVAQALIDSLSDAEKQSIDSAWIQECENRLAVYRNGKLESVEADDVFALTDREISE